MEKLEHAKAYFTDEKINISLVVHGNEIIIRPSIFKIRILLHLFIVACIVTGGLNKQGASYLLPFLLLVVIFYLIWSDFELINDIIITPENETLRVKSRNLIRQLFSNPKQIPFSMIETVKISSEGYVHAIDRRNILTLTLKNGSKVNLLDVRKEKHASYIASLLLYITKQLPSAGE